jgi:hypothetical protein
MTLTIFRINTYEKQGGYLFLPVRDLKLFS